MKIPQVFIRVTIVTAAAILLAQVLLAEMIPLEDSRLSKISGQEGIALDLKIRINSDDAGQPLGSLSSCFGTGNPCTYSVQFDNRQSGGGEWLVLKDVYGIMKINSLHLDAGSTSSSPSPYPNQRRFLSQDGSSCLTGQGSPPNCTANDLPALIMSFPGDTGVFENDIEWSLNIGRVAIQYGPEGFLPANDNGLSFLGLRIADHIHPNGRIDIDGTISLFGF